MSGALTRPELERFRAVRAGTLALVTGLSQRDSESEPASGVWSAGEVLDHLRLFDELIVGDIEELIGRWRAGKPAFLYRGFGDLGATVPGIPASVLPFLELPLVLGNAFLPRAWRARLLRARNVPAQAPARTIPRRGRPIAELRIELVALPDRLQGALDANPGLELGALRYYSPITGFTNAAAFLDLLANHERRHQGQLRDVLAAVAAG